MPSCFAQPSILRKPLLSAERNATKKAILVTGSTGYIGSRIVERLLACGHNVHVLCRPRVSPGPGDMLQYLKMLPGAEQQLTVVTGDVTDPAALQAAMSQCEQLVHLAAVVDVAPPRDEDHKQQMIRTALNGTRMVLDAATAAGSISKVILASSIVSIMWDWWERGQGYVYSEVDWTLDRSVALNCYAYCKRESERLAYDMAQGKSWELATINPGIVFGPVAAPKLADSISVWQPIVEHMNGAKYPFTSNVYVSHVDLDDVAAATCGLLATPGAAGRHLLMSGPAPSMPHIARMLAAAYPMAKVPYLTAPGVVVGLLAKFCSRKMGFDEAKFMAMHNKPYSVDATKIQRVLPDFKYIPLADSVRAAADSVVAMGLASFVSPTTSSCFGLLSSLTSLAGMGVNVSTTWGQLCNAWSDPAACAAAAALASVAEATRDAAAATAAVESEGDESSGQQQARASGESGSSFEVTAFIVSSSATSATDSKVGAWGHGPLTDPPALDSRV